MRVESTKQVRSGPTRGAPGEAALAPAEHDAHSRALVVQAPAATTVHTPPMNYREAQFLAHLIATKDHLPQTRERRRAEPAEAIAAYRAVDAMSGR